MKTKKSKIKLFLARILACIGFTCVLFSCFLIPASADQIKVPADGDYIVYDPWFRNGHVFIPSNVNNYSAVYNFNDVAFAPSENSTSSYTDFWYASNPNGTRSTLSIVRSISRSLMLYRITDANVNNVFSKEFIFEINDLVVDYDTLTRNNVGHIVFSLSKPSDLSGVYYDISYYYPAAAGDGGQFLPTVTTYENSFSPGVVTVDIPIIPFRHSSDQPDHDFVRFPTYQGDNGVPVYERYAYIDKLTVRVVFNEGASLSGFYFSSVPPSLAPTTNSFGYYWQQIPSYREEIIIDNTPNVDFTSWLVTAVGGFLDFELFPGFSISAVLSVVLAMSVVLLFLKWLAGG